ncbi:hypothetical protein [Mycolicibacterium mucogenicum]|uniref:hypothetical protein n=1 Tax=Mycolicibacterium mucogenicum TaxID=56689 RepID=UPI0013A59082|nr:hypothetical protein [Mycolicibacterium mucogenicum]
MRIRAAAAARAFERPDLLEPPPYRVLRLGNVGFPDCTAADLLRLARTCEEQLDPWPAIGRWLRDVAAAGNGYLKTSGYTLDDLAEARAELWGQRVANGQCCMSPWRCAQRYCPLPL